MDPDYEHFLIIRSVEHTDSSAFRQTQRRTPQEVVIEFGGAGVFEAEDLTSLRIDPRQHVTYGSVFARRIHRLEYKQQRISVVRIMQTLHLTKLFYVFVKKFAVLLLRFIDRFNPRRPLLEPHFGSLI